ncbi:MAG: hypothetical protein AAF456_08510 [Planctomycetota bacterium]
MAGVAGLILLCVVVSLTPVNACAQVDVQAQNRAPETAEKPPVYMHYMPWFETPETTGGKGWGVHWQMANCDPELVGEDGRRQIAAHFYPKIGPYASIDPRVIEYHFLLMRLCGIKGILIDWYGVQGRNGDIESLLRNSNAIVDATERYGLEFAIVLEDQFARSANDITVNVNWLQEYYFGRSNYIRVGEENKPLLMVFGPQFAQQPEQWGSILNDLNEPVALMPLWGESGDAGEYSSGEFAWVWENGDENNHIEVLTRFLDREQAEGSIVAGSLYPGFVDFYEEGGAENRLAFEIPHDNGQTLRSVIDVYSADRLQRCDLIQAVTWNDFGEGTMFEPTIETGFSYLVQLQQFTGTGFDESDLELVHQLYLARRKWADDQEKWSQLNEVSRLLRELKVDEAYELLYATID